MAAPRPSRRRWLVRRRRFQDAGGGQVTHIWLNIPFLPRHIRTWRSPNGRWGQAQFDISLSGSGVIGQGILIGAAAIGVYDGVSTGDWMPAIFGCLVMLAAFYRLAILWRRERYQP